MSPRFQPSNPRTRAAILALFAGFLAVQPVLGSTDYASRPEVLSFIESLRDEHGVDSLDLERIFGEVRHQPVVVRLIGPEPNSLPPQLRSYPAYRAKFLTPSLIASGARFWSRHEEHLARAEKEFGVPAEVILGILGVETAFGRNPGSFRVIDALTTIAFDGPRRQDFFRDELKELLLLAHETGIDPLAVKGSYAGAMGLPQFMPSSYRRYAVDFDGDGVVDILKNPVDAIGSIASYMKAVGWMAGEAATSRVRLVAGSEPDLVSGLQRVHEVATLREMGVEFRALEVPEGPCAIIELPIPGRDSQYLAGFANFEAVTRYNRSTFYAAAVLELAVAIRQAHRQMQLASAPVTGHPLR